MHLRFVTLALFAAGSVLLFMSNKNGRASSAGRGNTGAPGDELSGGQPRTCITCHNQGPITASLAISVLDSAGMAVSQYQPGKSYTAQVKITASGADLSGYGFQMIALRDNGNTDLDGFTDVNPNNYKIATINNGRTYAEHDNISTSNTFNVRWTAPSAGTGAVTFYACGNGVNGNGTTSGDGAGINSLRLTEFGTVDTPEAPEVVESLRVFPNPAAGDTRLWTVQQWPDGARVRVFDLSGAVVWQSNAVATPEGIVLPASSWRPGVYWVSISDGLRQAIVKMVKV